MIVSTKLVAAVTGGLMLAMAYTPAFAQSATATSAAAQSAVAPTANGSMLGILSTLATDVGPHQAQKPCKADTLYSQHSVVGDPNACFMSKVDARAGATLPGGVIGIP